MRKIVLIFLMGCSHLANAQLYDAQWALGDNESVLDFRQSDTVGIYTIPTFEFFTLTNACISDETGDLLYYTNGIGICGVTDTLLNGSGLSPCTYTDAYASIGLNIQQAGLFIPKPSDTTQYYLFHFSNDALDESRPGTIYYSIIDKEGNGGLGAVTSKNIPILQGVVLRGGGMTACKHANGRDYWIVMGASQVNTYYTFLVTPDSIFGPFTQDIGPAVSDTGDIAYSKFTEDGSRFATGFYSGPIILMDFDRCSGEFSNVQTIYNNASDNPVNNPIEGSESLEFAPNGSFLYAINANGLVQYDLETGNIQDSVQLYVEDSNEYYGIGMLQLAPNGKLYASTWNGGLKALHVVNYPDLKGDSAMFIYAGQPTNTTNSINVPNLINYRLGALVNSGCDTIPTALNISPKETSLLRIMPNPADKYVYVEMGMQGNYEFDLLNTLGQVIDRKETRQVDIFDTENLGSGVYFLRVTEKGSENEVATQKIIIAH